MASPVHSPVSQGFCPVDQSFKLGHTNQGRGQGGDERTLMVVQEGERKGTTCLECLRGAGTRQDMFNL